MFTEEFGGLKVPAPTLSEDDAFGSNPATGKIVYRMPSVAELLNLESA